MSNARGLLAVSPLLVFIAVYLVTSIIAGDFYKMPLPVAFLIASVYAVAISRQKGLNERIATYSRGASDATVMLMIWVFILAGAFAEAAKAAGCVDSTVSLMLHILPDNMVLAGLFVATCFISIAIGTSVGAIAAIVPIAAGIAEATSCDAVFVVAIVVGGAFFGDNLSFISDTTIAATTTMGCRMSDKFKVNAAIVLPVALVVLIIYIVLGMNVETPSSLPPVQWMKVLPYAVVFLTAIFGLNVALVLASGLFLTAMIGIIDGSYDFYGWATAAARGITGMGELIIITMMAAGMFEVIRHNGGIDYIIGKITRRIHSRRGAETVAAALVVAVDVCTANNTVAIITTATIARNIADRFHIDRRRMASILDTFSCCAQGVIPYGAQLLTASSLAGIAAVSIIPHLYYPFILAAFALVAIAIGYPKKWTS